LFRDRGHPGLLDVPRVAGDTFAWVRAEFSPREVVELLLTVGYFRMMDRLVTALDLELETSFGVQALERARDAARGAEVVA
jgi:hypothetical protein